MMMTMMLMMGKGRGGSGSEDAGRCLFKTRTQHHRMVGKKNPRKSLHRLSTYTSKTHKTQQFATAWPVSTKASPTTTTPTTPNTAITIQAPETERGSRRSPTHRKTTVAMPPREKLQYQSTDPNIHNKTSAPKTTPRRSLQEPSTHTSKN